VINGPGQIVVSVIPPSGQPVPVFAINIAFSASASVPTLKHSVVIIIDIYKMVNADWRMPPTHR
jgi:hypothetical protein